MAPLEAAPHYCAGVSRTAPHTPPSLLCPGRLDFIFSVTFYIFGNLDPSFLAPGYSFFHRQTTKQHTNVNEHDNALNSSDLQAYENLQAILLFAFIKQRHAHQL